jgi:hypothetical protein
MTFVHWFDGIYENKMLYYFVLKITRGLGEAAVSLIFGGNYMVYLQKGKKELDVNSVFGKNCMIFKKKIFWESALINGACYRRGKKPWIL